MLLSIIGLKLLDPTKSGIFLTEAGQIIPDQSTASIVVHHPEAEYFHHEGAYFVSIEILPCNIAEYLGICFIYSMLQTLVVIANK
jgi:hypothetical protein